MNKKIVLLVLAAILIAGAVYVWSYWNQGFLSEVKEPINQAMKEKISGKSFLKIDFGDGKINETELDFMPGLTAFDLTKLGIEKMGFTMISKPSDFGILVEEINGYKSGQDNKYWLYYQNGQTAPTSADKLEIKPGDKIEWRFEKPSF